MRFVGLKTEQGCERAIFAGGCFWGVEDLLRELPGVIETEVGYTGGQIKDPIYDLVKTGKTGHAEAIQIKFDPKILPYETLLQKFFKMHNPTTLNQQGNDIGTQYRSAIFYTSPQQKETAYKVIKEVEKSGFWKKPLTTEVTAASVFYPAESYHQNYLQKNKNGYTCHIWR